MGRSNRIAATPFVALALAVAGACGGGDSSSEPSTTGATLPLTTTTTVPTTTTTTAPKTPEALKAALPVGTDIPGSTSTPATRDDDDLTLCFPGNPLAVKTDPMEVVGPDLDLTQGGVRRSYGSAARQATAEQAATYVAAFTTPAGSACRLSSFKVALSADPEPPRVDASGLTGSATTAAVADGGALLSITGNVISGGKPVPAGFDLLVFRKGGVVVFLDVGAFRGSAVPGQTLELARKVAGRLS